MIVNVCPAATSKAPPDRIWEVVTTPERFDDWVDARLVSVDPPGPARPGQVMHFAAPFLGLKFPVRIDVGDMDPERQWIDLVAHLPFGIANHEHLTLTPTPDGGTLVRFN